MSQYARFLWLTFGLWEDLLGLTDAYKTINVQEIRLIIARHVLVDLDSLDELLKEFQSYVKTNEAQKLEDSDAKIILNAFSAYHKKVEPYRKLLKDIRNYLGSHRTGVPWEKAKKSGVTSPNEWGVWEQLLVKLESECALENWKDVFNAAYELIIVLKDFNLDAWYGFSDDGHFHSFMPIQKLGYYPRDTHVY